RQRAPATGALCRFACPPPPAPSAGLSRFGSDGARTTRRDFRQTNVESRSSVCRRFDIDPAAVALHDLVDDEQSQTQVAAVAAAACALPHSREVAKPVLQQDTL